MPLLLLKGSDWLSEQSSRLSNADRADLGSELLRIKIAIDIANASGKKVSTDTRIALWLLNVEFTNRRVPPALRHLPDINDDDPDQIADLFAADLQWLVTQYPNQEPLYTRWRGMWKQTAFHPTSDYIAENYPRRAMYWFCKGLRIDDDQQRELHIIKRENLQRELGRLRAELEPTRIALTARYHARDSRYKTEDDQATITRRLNIWFCGSLAQWKPQRTATLYEAHTGEAITRQLAQKIIQQVQRDLPGNKWL